MKGESIFMKIIRHFLFIILILFIFSVSCSNALTDEEKIRTFYKNDWMFFFGEKEGLKPALLAEESNQDELFSIDKVSEKYRSIVKEYISTFQEFIKSNISKIKDYHNYIVKKSSTKDYFLEIDKELTKSMTYDLLPKLKNSARCMLSVEDIQYIEAAKKIDKDKYAVTLTLNTVDNVYWTRLLHYQIMVTPQIFSMHREQ
jgi:hypothetical protein